MDPRVRPAELRLRPVLDHLTRGVAAVGGGYRPRMARARGLVRPRSGKMIAGVCAALADRLGTSTFLVRLAFVIFGFVGAGEVAYIILWIIIPKEPR